MLNWALFRKSFQDGRWTIAACFLAVTLFSILFVWAMVNMGQELMDFAAKIGFVRKMLEVAFGVRVQGELSINIVSAIVYTHGVVLGLTWAAIVAAAMRVTTREIERGTADLLLTLPVSRPEVYVSSSAVWVFAAGLMSLAPILGVGIASQCIPSAQEIVFSRFCLPAVNFFGLNCAVGGICTLLGAVFHRQGLVIGLFIAIGLGSIAIIFLEPFLSFVKYIRFLSLLNYFRPVDIVRTGEFPFGPTCLLLALGVACWLVGLILFCRKDIHTA